MVRIGKPLGFIVGLSLGVITRDHFIYPYAIKAQDLEENFKEFERLSDEMELAEVRKIRRMERQFEKVQGIYINKKHS